jgi:hypothetical protein
MNDTDITENIDTSLIDYDSSKVSKIIYNIDDEQEIEQSQLDYHTNKNFGDWYYSKMIISHSWQDKNNTEFFTDYLEKQLQANNDSFENINIVYYKNELDIDIVYSFVLDPCRHLIDNLRIPSYKPNGIIFNNPDDINKWSFKIVVITTKGIYTANRYINETHIGFY